MPDFCACGALASSIDLISGPGGGEGPGGERAGG